jgi:hypothetical protein
MKLLERDARLVPEAIGHRMVHGGAIFKDHVIVDEVVFAHLEEVQDLAPIHNPPALRLLSACRQLYPKLPETVVFDTAFHSTIPPAARTYALPAKLARTHGFRKYGFHGTSHQYVAQEAAKFLGIPMAELRAVSCHLGSGGASLCAIVNGKSVDNTMGYSPLQGLVISRCAGHWNRRSAHATAVLLCDLIVGLGICYSSAERLAVQLQARRRAGASILHQCPCGRLGSTPCSAPPGLGRRRQLSPVPNGDDPDGRLFHPIEKAIRWDNHLAVGEFRELWNLPTRLWIRAQPTKALLRPREKRQCGKGIAGLDVLKAREELRSGGRREPNLHFARIRSASLNTSSSS